MKSYNFKIKLKSLTFAGLTALLAATVFLGGCEKPGITSEDFDASNLRVVNGLPGRSNVKFYLDTFNLTMGGFINYNQNSVYYVVRSGARTSKFYSTATTDTFATQSIQLDVNKDYTLYLGGAVGAPKYWLTEDELVSGPNDKAKIRLANLSTGVNVDVTIQLEDLITPPQPKPEVPIFSNISNQTVSAYTSATVPTSKGNAVIQRHTIRVYEAGTNTLLATATNVDLRGTSINTIILAGNIGGSPGLTIRAVREWLDW